MRGGRGDVATSGSPQNHALVLQARVCLSVSIDSRGMNADTVRVGFLILINLTHVCGGENQALGILLQGADAPHRPTSSTCLEVGREARAPINKFP